MHVIHGYRYLISDGLEFWWREWQEVHEAISINNLAGLPMVGTPHPRLF
jgi:hypothetical protein